MNERTKELAEQAGWSGLYTTYNEPTGESNWEMVKESITVPVTSEQIERFAELIRDDERETCAKLCDELLDGEDRGRGYWSDGVRNCFDAIRARSSHDTDK